MPAVSPQDLELLEVMAAVLDGLCEDNQDMRLTSPTIFDSVARPAMSIQAYLVRLRRYTKFDITCFPVAVLYLADLCEAHGPAFCPTYHNIHRLLVTQRYEQRLRGRLGPQQQARHHPSRSIALGWGPAFS